MDPLIDHNYNETQPIAIKKEPFPVLETCIHIKTEPLPVPDTDTCLHQSQELFNCSASTLNTYECDVCGFKTNMRILAHKFCHKLQPTDSPFSKYFSENYVCKKCNFQTYSRLVYMRHVYVKCPTKIQRKWYERDQYTTDSLLRSLLTQTNAVTTDKLYNPNDEHNYCLMIAQPPQQFETVYVTEEHNDLIIDESSSKRKKTKPLIKKTEKLKELDWYYCGKCKYRTSTVCSLRKHIADSHSEKKVTKNSNLKLQASKSRDVLPERYRITGGFACLYCSFKTTKDQILINHILTEHSKPGQIKDCLYCRFKAVQDQVLIDHIFKRHLKQVQVSACKYCRFTTSSRAYLKKHFQQNHIWICPYCSDRPTSQLALSAHITTNHKPIHCSFCQYSTQFRYELMQHLEEFHSNECQCSSCGFVAETEVALSEHLATAHQLMKCIHCHFSTVDDQVLDEHLREMHVDKCFDVASKDDGLPSGQLSKCSTCLFVTHSQTALAKHRWYKCDYCSYSTCVNDVLRKHVSKWHFRCTECPFECDSKLVLSRHFMAHHKVKLYSCEACSFKDSVKANIEEHIMKEHTNADEALKCGLCPFKTGNRTDLDNHLFQEHGQKFRERTVV